jgi:hypothetical protein
MAGEAQACSCAAVPADAIIAQSAVAFRGKVQSVTMSRERMRQLARIKVVSTIKASVPRRITVTTSSRPGLCGYPVIPGRTYTFAGSLDRAGQLPITMCGMVPINR